MELIKGQIYKWHQSHIFMYNGIADKKSTYDVCKALYYLYGNSLHYQSDNFCSKNGVIEATLEEQHWLEECIKHNKFIDYNDAMKTFNKTTNLILYTL